MSKSKLFVIGLFVFAGGLLFMTNEAEAAAYTPKVGLPAEASAKAGDLIKTKTNATVFLVDDNLKRIPLSREAYVVRYGNNWTLVKVVEDSQIGSFDQTSGINALSSHASGTLVVYTLNNPEVFKLENGFKKSLGHRTDLTGVQWIGTYEIYPTKSN